MNDEAKQLGVMRQAAHPFGTPRYYDDPNSEDVLGMRGELAFEQRYGLTADRKIRPDGDGHIDFTVTINGKATTIDVKIARKPGNLLVKDHEINVCADILVLAGVDDNDQVQFIGWETKDEMKLRPRKYFSSLKILNYYIPAWALRPMEELDKILGTNQEKTT